MRGSGLPVRLAMAAALAGALAWKIAGRDPLRDAPNVRGGAAPQLRGLPFYFEANRGQTDARVAFLARARGYTAFVMPTGLVVAVAPARKIEPRLLRSNGHAPAAPAQPPVRMILAGAAPAAVVQGRGALAGQVHYFIGRDPQRWVTHVPTYARVEARDVYPGIDVVYSGAERRLAFDVVVRPGADPAALRLAFEGAAAVQVDARGDLVLGAGAGELRLRRPVIYQPVEDGGRMIVAGGYVLHPSEARLEVGVELGPYDRTRPLVIDPVLTYSTYLGGSEDEVGYGIAVDAAGQIYVTGPTLSLNFPTENPIQPDFAGGLATSRRKTDG